MQRDVCMGREIPCGHSNLGCKSQFGVYCEKEFFWIWARIIAMLLVDNMNMVTSLNDVMQANIISQSNYHHVII